MPQRWHESVEAELAAVQSGFAQMEADNFATARDILISSREVFATGFQSVRGLAEDHPRCLSIARSGVRYLSPHDGMLAEWIEGQDADRTCLRLIDVVPYARESQPLAALARDQGRKVIVVSDEYCHWSRNSAAAVFYAPSATRLFLESALGLMRFWRCLWMWWRRTRMVWTGTGLASGNGCRGGPAAPSRPCILHATLL